MMRTRRRRYLILTAILIALPLLYLVEERVRGEWLLARTRRELSAGGEKLTINELLPRVPEGTNVVLLTPDQARSQFNLGSRTGDEVPATARMLSPGRAVVSWRRDRWLDKEAKAYTWDDFARATAGRLEQLPELRSQLTNRVLHVTLNYGEGWTLLLPHLAAFKGACQALCQAAVYDLHQGDLAPALDNLHAVARLTDLLRNEPLMIDQLVRVAIAAIARGTIWEALQADGWTDDQLVLLQSDWAGMHFTPAMVHALRMERAMNLTYFPGGANFSRNSIRQALGWGSGAFGGGSGGTPVGGGGVGQWIDALGLMIEPLTVLARIELWRHVWAPLDQRFYLEANQEIIDFGSDALARTNLGLLPNLEERGTNLIGGRLLLRRLTDEPALRQRFLASGLFAVANAKALGKCAQADAWNRVLVTAIALKRFHLKHGRPPEQLGELVPAFLPEIPIDWMDGEPLRYRLNPDSTWLLYSVGEDGNDDGGDAECPRQTNPSWTLARDYVWPQAATPEAVDAVDAEIIAKKEAADAEAEKWRRQAPPATPSDRYGVGPGVTNGPPRRRDEPK